MSIDIDNEPRTDTEAGVDNQIDSGDGGTEQAPNADEPTATPLSEHENASADGGSCAVGRSTRWSRLRASVWQQGIVLVLVMIVAIGAVGGWLGWQVYREHRVERIHTEQLQAARQGALNLTTVDWQHVDRDVQRILDSATGAFFDDFTARAKPFAEVVTKAQSKSEGTVTSGGLESATDTTARALVAVSVKISNAGAAEREPRLWRMRLTVDKVGDDMKVSNVEFVP